MGSVMTFVLRGWRTLEEFGTCPLKHGYLLTLLCSCLLVFDDIYLRFINFVRSCITHQSTLVSSITRYSITYGQFSSPAGRNMLCCAQRCSCAVEDLIKLFSGSVRSVVNACVHRCVNDNQLQTVGLLQECIMISDGMAHLPDAFTVGR